MSIKPEYSSLILKGIKKYEFRTKIPTKHIDKIYIYETYPTKRIVGEVSVKTIISLTPTDLWKTTSQYAGISKKKYDEYFKNRKIGYAYELGDVIKYETTKNINDFGLKHAPQSFVYTK